MIVAPGATATSEDTLPPLDELPTQEYLERYALTDKAIETNFIRSQEPKTPEEIYQRLRYFPNQVLLETSSFCQLQCTMCVRQFKSAQVGAYGRHPGQEDHRRRDGKGPLGSYVVLLFR
jgi:hypothetical protein